MIIDNSNIFIEFYNGILFELLNSNKLVINDLPIHFIVIIKYIKMHLNVYQHQILH